MILHPQVAAIDCEDCRKFVYDLKTGQRRMNGKYPIRRGKAGPACLTDDTVCPKVRPGHSDLTPQNMAVLQHYSECRAVGAFPDDGAVRGNAAVLDRVYESVEHERRTRQLEHQSEHLARILLIARRSI